MSVQQLIVVHVSPNTQHALIHFIPLTIGSVQLWITFRQWLKLYYAILGTGSPLSDAFKSVVFVRVWDAKTSCNKGENTSGFHWNGLNATYMNVHKTKFTSFLSFLITNIDFVILQVISFHTGTEDVRSSHQLSSLWCVQVQDLI